MCFNLLAFAIHTVCDLASGAWRHARETLGPRARFFQNLQGLTSYQYLRTSSAANVGADRDSDNRQREAIAAFAKRAGFVLAALLDRIQGNCV